MAASWLNLLLPFGPIVQEDAITYHKHWWVLLRQMVLPLLFTGVAILALVYVLPLFQGWPKVGVAAGSFLPLFWLYWRYENWRNDYYVVTRDRILDVEALPLAMGTEIREAPLSNVQNVTMRIPNVMAASLDYGDILVETAGHEGQLTFLSLPHPRQVLQEVMSRVSQYRQRREDEEAQRRLRETLEWFVAYNEVNRILVLRSPHQVKGGETIDVEWRVAGLPAQIETYLSWDVTSHPQDDYPYTAPPLQGGIGNYEASFSAPVADRVYFKVFATSQGVCYRSLEHQVDIRP
ncbi:MAG: PH domain-containing protein [Chloroflexi bacterium]|nr:PH domain-containing protein [Chloroflexota bacterium]